jgi:formate dehydrogenase subunit gamma
MLGLSVLMIGHVYFTFLYGALPAMRTGFVSEGYARMEHRRWFESLAAEALVVPAATEAPAREAVRAPDPVPPAPETAQGAPRTATAPPQPPADHV